jgi:transcription elongation factor GreA
MFVYREGYDKIVGMLNRMVNVEMENLTRELSKVSDVSGDIRENVEYNTLMEKQAILKMAINKLEGEIKKAEVLDLEKVPTESVNIGTRVSVEDVKSGEKNSYTILGPWDADYEKRILSYRSPIARALLGRKTGDIIDMRFGDEVQKLRILSIGKHGS